MNHQTVNYDAVLDAKFVEDSNPKRIRAEEKTNPNYSGQIGLNVAQMDFLRLLGHFTTVEQVAELRQLVCDYYARKVDDAIDKLWDEGKWDNEKNEAILNEHLRTPYQYAK